MLMLWLTYSKRLNCASHILNIKDDILTVRDTPIARLFSRLGAKLSIDELTHIEATSTHVFLYTATNSVDIFINKRFIDGLIMRIKEISPDLEVKDTRPSSDKKES